MIIKSIYRVSFDAVVDGKTEREDQPVVKKLVVATCFEDAYERAKELKAKGRPGKVHKGLEIRDIKLVHLYVVA